MEARGALPEATSAANAVTIAFGPPHAVQREPANARDVADVDAIHDVVEHVDQLGDDRRNGQPHQQPADRLRAQKRLISGLHIKQILSR